MQKALFIAYVIIDSGTFIYLTFFNEYIYTAFN